MKNWTAFPVVLGLIIGCAGRVPLYSPRLLPTDEHKAATSNPDCLGCHDPVERASHKPDDDCRNCHTLHQER